LTPASRIKHIKQQIAQLGPFLPGSISEQWNVCGKIGCACKDARKPLKHGPYYQLSFSVKGRSSSMFLKPEQLAEALRRIARYQRFKQLNFDLTQACVDLARHEGLKKGDL
jgi:hypothetical protein